MSDFEKTNLNKVRRVPNRGAYDRKTLNDILDAGFLCHVGYMAEGRPVVIPTSYGRDGDDILIHGSSKSRLIKVLASGEPCCITVTHLDGLVLARSVFHHSMNYRSAVVFGKAELVEDPEEKMEALRIITDNILEGRWDEARLPNEIEMKATGVLRVKVDTASSKVRTGPPGDEEADYALPIWAGLLPVKSGYEAPVADPRLTEGIEVPDSVSRVGE